MDNFGETCQFLLQHSCSPGDRNGEEQRILHRNAGVACLRLAGVWSMLSTVWIQARRCWGRSGLDAESALGTEDDRVTASCSRRGAGPPLQCGGSQQLVSPLTRPQ